MAFAKVLLLLGVIRFGTCCQFEEMPFYGDLQPLDVHESFITSRIACASRCCAHDGVLKCNAFSWEHGLCQMFYAEKADEIEYYSETSIFFRVDVKETPIEEDCAPPSIYMADQFDIADCPIWAISCKSDDYGAEGVFKNGDCKTFDKNVWFAKKSGLSQEIVIDLGCMRKVQKIRLLNHFNKIGGTISRDLWGTKDFSLWSAITKEEYEPFKWSKIESGTLPDNSHLQPECKVPIYEVDLGEGRNARYISFVAVNYHGEGAALQFMGLVFADE